MDVSSFALVVTQEIGANLRTPITIGTSLSDGFNEATSLRFALTSLRSRFYLSFDVASVASAVLSFNGGFSACRFVKRFGVASLIASMSLRSRFGFHR